MELTVTTSLESVFVDQDTPGSDARMSALLEPTVRTAQSSVTVQMEQAAMFQMDSAYAHQASQGLDVKAEFAQMNSMAPTANRFASVKKRIHCCATLGLVIANASLGGLGRCALDLARH